MQKAAETAAFCFAPNGSRTRNACRRPRPTPGVGAMETSGRRLVPHPQALVLEQVMQLASLEHLTDDVAAAHELALDVELRNGGPLGIGLDALPQVVGLEHVDALVGHTQVIEDLHDLPGEPALRELRG